MIQDHHRLQVAVGVIGEAGHAGAAAGRVRVAVGRVDDPGRPG